jgi:putative redox protein
MTEVNLRWVEEKVFIGVDSNNHGIVIGCTDAENPVWKGAKPSDLLLLAVASCASFDVVEILKKQREPLQGLRVVCSGDQMAGAPYSFTKIHNHYIVTGQIKLANLEMAIRLSEQKYCSVISSLGSQVVFSSDYKIEG